MMRTEVKADPQGVAAKAATLIKDLINSNNKLGKATVLGLATGSTPLPLYKKLVEFYQNDEVDFSRVITFNLDEYVGLKPDHPQSYHYFMHTHFFNQVNIKKENIHLLNGMIDNPQELERHIREYELAIKQVGGIDIQILGVGGNGHIAFNEPGSDFKSLTRLVDLNRTTLTDNARFFESPDHVPTQALTMGIGTILENTKQCLVLATGLPKAKIIFDIYSSKEPNQLIPATSLMTHSNTLFLLDRYAASYLDLSSYQQQLFFKSAESGANKSGVQVNKMEFSFS